MRVTWVADAAASRQFRAKDQRHAGRDGLRCDAGEHISELGRSGAVNAAVMVEIDGLALPPASTRICIPAERSCVSDK